MSSISIPLVVANGPFRGLRYPAAESVCSSLYPKLLGCYERELADIVEKICLMPYSEIIDIGCAEGYYANGFALRHRQAIVYAFDSDAKARKLCGQMAALNEVADRVRILEGCSADLLRRIPLRGRALLFSDCEGCELSLFTDDVVGGLRSHDFLIETHDFLRIEISTILEATFRRHGFHVTRIKSVDDIEKARTYDVPELRECTLMERFQILAEGRPRIMEWLWCTPQ
jgi:hypothetical protein